MENTNFSFQNRIDLQNLHSKMQAIGSSLKSVIVGQEQMIEHLLIALLSGGHVLLEGVPGVAKTLTVKLLAKILAVDFSRIQFTPDLMPSDVLGTSIFDLKNTEFTFKKGPIFANLVLIDEINRAPAKTQSALFEVMEERQITIDGLEFKMPPPFLVVATQNPIEQEGTYPLPEAQLDRFLFKISLPYPTLQEEIMILQREHQLKNQDKTQGVSAVLSSSEIAEYQRIIKEIRIEEQLISYIAQITSSTRKHPFIYLGASPRASIAMLSAGKALAGLRGRDFVTPEDIKQIAPAVLSHRIVLNPEKEMEGITARQVVEQMIEQIEIPR